MSASDAATLQGALLAAPPAGDHSLASLLGFSSVNAVYVFTGCVVLGITAGMVGCFAFLRKRSLLGDALSHAALPGVCVAFLLTETKEPLVILAGALVSCWLGALSVDFIVKHTRCKEDSALGMVLSVFFGLGIVLLTHIQQSGAAAQSGLDKFLFGQAASLLSRDVWTLSILGVVICGVVLLGYKEFKVFSFDPDFTHALGLPSRFIGITIASLIVLAVAIGLQAVGVVLMAAMLVTPAAAARYWTDRLGVMLVLAAVFGGLSGALGAWISYLGTGMPTGPWMVVGISTLFILSLLCAPRRGLAGRAYRQHRFRRRTAEENVLRTLYKLGDRLQQWDRSYSAAELIQHRQMNMQRLTRTLQRLQRKGYVSEDGDGLYKVTDRGLARAARLTRLHRLWELYLTRKLELAPDHVHDDAEEIEHILTPELEKRLVESLNAPGVDPHGRAIPLQYLPTEQESGNMEGGRA
jgi:manganese/zinc/iron transport system permease protein